MLLRRLARGTNSSESTRPLPWSNQSFKLVQSRSDASIWPSRLVSNWVKASRPLLAVRRPSLLPKYSDNSSLIEVIWPSPLRSTTTKASLVAVPWAVVWSQAVGKGKPRAKVSKRTGLVARSTKARPSPPRSTIRGSTLPSSRIGLVPERASCRSTAAERLSPPCCSPGRRAVSAKPMEPESVAPTELPGRRSRNRLSVSAWLARELPTAGRLINTVVP